MATKKKSPSVAEPPTPNMKDMFGAGATSAAPAKPQPKQPKEEDETANYLGFLKNFHRFDTAFQHLGTGEMWVPRSDGLPGLVPTGFYFELVTQGQPKIDNMEGPRDQQVRITPWAFATRETATRVASELKPIISPDTQLTIEDGDTNTQFPYSHDMLQIRAKRGGRSARINAGLLAGNIARTTALVPEVKQFPRLALEAAAAELMRGLEEPKDD